MVKEYIDLMTDLGFIIMEAIAISLNLPKDFFHK